MNRLSMFILPVLIGMTILSCGRSVDPVTTPLDSGGTVERMSCGNTIVWGFWEIYCDPDSGEIEAVPMRGAMLTANINRFLEGPPSNLLLTMVEVDPQAGYTDITVDIGIRHPFPGLDRFTGFDVLGVFMGNGSDVYFGLENFAVAGENDPQLLNADGYTRWFNYSEFESAGSVLPLVGYYPGHAGSVAFGPTAVLNPYKYFADGIAQDDNAYTFMVYNYPDRGAFRPGSINRRIYELRFPQPEPIKFQYAVIAHWEPNVNDPDPPASLDDFPTSANVEESVAISVMDTSDIFYDSPSVYGGDVVLDISVVDWSEQAETGEPDEYEIRIYSPAWTEDGGVDMTIQDWSYNWRYFHAEIPVEFLDGPDPIPAWIEIRYPGRDYSNDLGVANDADGALAGYFRIDIPISGSPPGSIEVVSPNGGEVINSGDDYEITWNSSYVDGDVVILYSKDDFNTDINVITPATENDGTYDWLNVPDDPSDTVKVMVRSFDDPGISDVSDDYFTIQSTGPQTGWARNFGDGRTRCFGVAVDDNGNSYITGYFDPLFDPVDFDPGDGEDFHESNGGSDVFLSKFDNDGNYVWGRSWGGGSDDEGHGVAIDPVSGDVYVTGYFKGTVDFDPDTGGAANCSASGSDEIFVTRFDSDGNHVWVDSFGSSSSGYPSYYPFYIDSGEHVDADSSGNLYVAGKGGPMVVRKYDSSGTMLWESTFGDTETWDRAYGIASSETGDVFVCGRFTGTVDFDPGDGIDNHTATGKADNFVVKLDSDGNRVWAYHYGGTDKLTGYDDPPYYVDCAYAVDTDEVGDIYVTGIFYGTTDFDPGSGVESYTAGSPYGYGDGYVFKWNSAGEFEWVQVQQGQHFQYGYGVEACGDYVYQTGRFYYTVDFDPSGGTDDHTSAGDCDIYISRYDASGNWYWTRSWGAGSYDIGSCTAIDQYGNVWMSGYFNNEIDFDPGAGVDNHSSVMGEDCVLVKLLPNGFWE